MLICGNDCSQDLRPGMVNICFIAQVVTAVQDENGVRISLAVLAGLTDCQEISLQVMHPSLVVDRIMAGSIVSVSGAHVSADGNTVSGCTTHKLIGLKLDDYSFRAAVGVR